MTAPADASPLERLADAVAQHLTALTLAIQTTRVDADTLAIVGRISGQLNAALREARASTAPLRVQVGPDRHRGVPADGRDFERDHYVRYVADVARDARRRGGVISTNSPHLVDHFRPEEVFLCLPGCEPVSLDCPYIRARMAAGARLGEAWWNSGDNLRGVVELRRQHKG